MKISSRFFVPIAALALAVAPTASAERPLPRAHAHNDYQHDRPLFDALEQGFCSVEADIWLVDGELLVAHDREDVEPERTLRALYLEPLHQRAQKYGGRIYPAGPEFQLLIDIKSEGEPTFAVLREQLTEFEDSVTTFTEDTLHKRAVRVVVSGNRPKDAMLAHDLHYAGYDGRLNDLDSDLSRHFMPLISSSWYPTFEWRGRGPIAATEKRRLADILERAHAQGRKLRFWAIPHRESFWDVFYDMGVDYINADDLAKLGDYLREREQQDD